MEFLITYLIYILGLVAVVFLFLFFVEKIKALNLRHDLLKYLVDKGYETVNIDLNNYLK